MKGTNIFFGLLIAIVAVSAISVGVFNYDPHASLGAGAMMANVAFGATVSDPEIKS